MDVKKIVESEGLLAFARLSMVGMPIVLAFFGWLGLRVLDKVDTTAELLITIKSDLRVTDIRISNDEKTLKTVEVRNNAQDLALELLKETNGNTASRVRCLEGGIKCPIP